MSYDKKCYDLAKVFLDDVEQNITEQQIGELAQEIQDTIEEYIRFELEPKGEIK